MIEFISEDIKKGTRIYRIEHGGNHGKDEHNVEVSLNYFAFYVDCKGGSGGKYIY